MTEHPKLPDIVERVRVIVIDPLQRSGICVGGRLDGWLMRKHPDGQWVSIRKLEQEEIGDPFSDAGAALSGGRDGATGDGEGLRDALVRIEIITASGRTDELLGKMKTINSLAHSALSNSISPGEK